MKIIESDSFKKMAGKIPENEDKKPAMEGEVYSLKNEEEYLSKNKGKLQRRGVPKKEKSTWDDVVRKMRETKSDPQYAKSKENLKK